MNTLVTNLDQINPVYIPRNHQIQDVIDQAYNDDFSKMLEIVEVIKNPFTDKKEYLSYKEAPSDNQKIQRTFCGT